MRKIKSLIMVFIMLAVAFTSLSANVSAENGIYECPNCGTIVDYGQPICHGCGIILEWDEEIEATIDIDPDSLNLNSKGKYVTVYIELPEEYGVHNIELSTVKIIKIGDTAVELPAEAHPSEIGDHDGDGLPDLMVKFCRHDLLEAILDIIGDDDHGTFETEIVVSGGLIDGTLFIGCDLVSCMLKDDKDGTCGGTGQPCIKWECGSCGHKWECSSQKCPECGKTGKECQKWQCQKCDKIWECSSNKCPGCGGSGKECQKWQCPECNKIWECSSQKCSDCGKAGHECQKWQCNKCDHIWECSSQKCPK